MLARWLPIAAVLSCVGACAVDDETSASDGDEAATRAETEGGALNEPAPTPLPEPDAAVGPAAAENPSAPLVHVNDDAPTEEPAPAKRRWVTQTAEVETSVTVAKGQRFKMMGEGRAALETIAQRRGFEGVRRIKLSEVACIDECTAKVTGTAWKKVRSDN